MDKAITAMKKKKIAIFGFWIALLYLVVLCIYFFILKKSITVVEVIFIFAIGCFVYVDVALSKEYMRTKKIMSAVKSIESRYEYMQTYIEENTMIIEIQKKEVERLKKDIEELRITMEQLKEDKELIQFYVKM